MSKKAMILAAGLGTRLKPLTDNRPKALVEINGKPLLEIAIMRLKKFGFRDIVINVHHFAGQIIEFLECRNYFDLNIQISDETHELLDTGGGIKHAEPFLNGTDPFLVYNVDVLTNYNLNTLYNFHLINKPLATLLVQKRESTRQLLFTSEIKLAGWKNNSTNETLFVGSLTQSTNKLQEFAFSGVHVLDPNIFNHFPAENVFSIIPIYLQAAQAEPILGMVLNEGYWMDVGKPKQLQEAQEKNLEKSE